MCRHGVPNLDHFHHCYVRRKHIWKTKVTLKAHSTLPESIPMEPEHYPSPRRPLPKEVELKIREEAENIREQGK